MNENLQKVFLCVFLDIASIHVKTESHWGEWEMKAVTEEAV